VHANIILPTMMIDGGRRGSETKMQDLILGARLSDFQVVVPNINGSRRRV
jgi:hypothetical protein